MLSITNVSIRIAGRLLIDQATAQIAPGARVGLVGRNGTGKSTLFHAIRGELPVESGQITIPPRWRVGRLAQEAPDGPESLIEVVLAADLERAALLARSRDRARIRIGSPTSRPASPTSTPIRRRRARRRSCPASDFRPPTRRARVRNSPAAGACASRSPPRCSPSPICCCSTSRPTTSISRARCGWKTISRAIRAP